MENKVPLVPIGFEQPHPQTQLYPTNYGSPKTIPQQYNVSPTPPPLNATQVTYASPPLVNQQPTMAALNSTARYFQPFRRVGFRNRTHAYTGCAVFGVVFVVLLIVFLTIFFTVFNKVSGQFDEAKHRQDKLSRKYFSDW